jgi:hypothetical protein
MTRARDVADAGHATTATTADTISQKTSINLSGTYSTHQLLVADAYNFAGDLTVNDNLILGKISDDGNDLVLEGSHTLQGTGQLEAGYVTSSGISAEGLTGTLGSGVSIGSGVTGTLGSGVSFPTGKFIPLKGIIHSNGITSGVSGDNIDMLRMELNLTGYEGYTLYAWAHTTLAENANTANTGRIRIKLYNGSSTAYFAHQRQGIAIYSGIGGDANNSASITCMGYYTVPSTFATSCTIYMNGGLGGAFSWGAQPSYGSFDNETPNPGGTLGYMLFHP